MQGDMQRNYRSRTGSSRQQPGLVVPSFSRGGSRRPGQQLCPPLGGRGCGDKVSPSRARLGEEREHRASRPRGGEWPSRRPSFKIPWLRTSQQRTADNRIIRRGEMSVTWVQASISRVGRRTRGSGPGRCRRGSSPGRGGAHTPELGHRRGLARGRAGPLRRGARGPGAPGGIRLLSAGVSTRVCSTCRGPRCRGTLWPARPPAAPKWSRSSRPLWDEDMEAETVQFPW